MKSHTKNTPLKLVVSLLAMLLLAPALRSAEPTPWDTMKGTFYGSITVTTKTGKKLKRTGTASFSATSMTFEGISVPRQDVTEVVIRRQREICCGRLAVGIVPLLFVLSSIGSAEVYEDDKKVVIPMIIILSPVFVGMAAVTGPPLLIIEGIRRLKPAKILYRVVP
jgi:hypothetical protein